MASTKKGQDSDKKLPREMYARYQAGESKSSLEVEYWNNPSSHGKKFSSFMRVIRPGTTLTSMSYRCGDS